MEGQAMGKAEAAQRAAAQKERSDKKKDRAFALRVVICLLAGIYVLDMLLLDELVSWVVFNIDHYTDPLNPWLPAVEGGTKVIKLGLTVGTAGIGWFIAGQQS